MKPVIIALGGRSQTGKSTLAKRIAQEIEARYGYCRFEAPMPHATILQTSFAAPLRASIETLKKAIDVETDFWERQENITKEQFRPLYQSLADVTKKQLGKDVFAKSTARTIREFAKKMSNPVVVVDDLRYPCEVAALQKLAPVLAIEIRFNNESNLDHLHDSETALLGSDQWSLRLRIDKPQELWHKVEAEVFQHCEQRFAENGWKPYQ